MSRVAAFDTQPEHELADVPHERGIPILGVLPRLLRDPPAYLLEVSKKYPGELAALQLGPSRLYLVWEPEHVQHVVVDHSRNYSKGRMWDATEQLFGNGLLRSEGQFWLRQRRMMQPLFGSRHLASLVETMNGVVDRRIERLIEECSSSATVDVGKLMASLTQGVLLETMFGRALSWESANELGQHLIEALRAINLKVFLFFLPKAFPLPGAARLRRAIHAIDEAMLGLVASRRASGTRPDDLLSRLLRAQDDESRSMDDRQLRDELVNLFVAGNDTTAHALTFFWYVLATHPEVEGRVRDEVQSVLGSRNPSSDDINQLSYTRRVFQETMRLYPPVWMFPRYCAKGDVIDGYPIPAGASLLVLPWLAHRNPRVWEDPETFDPERFLPERVAKRQRYAYFPFGGGPRQCIGSAFAMIEAPLIIARLLQKFRFRLNAGYRMVPLSSSTLRPKGGLPMTVELLH